ncbi:MAG: zinc ribbon domain-containing protein [Clostridia bacterium]|nr:zinc ribbon domain-containing protein [Clostridia bacterium]
MPIFEYKCRKCGRKFEELVFGCAKVKCPDCGNDQVDKLPSAFGFKNGSEFVASTHGGGSCGSCGGGSCSACGH